MPTTRDARPQHAVTQDIPLPGFYPCLTLQLNVTRYQSEGLGKYVIVVREPSDHVEVKRVFCEVSEWDAVAKQVREAIAQCLVDLVWLQNGRQSF